MNFDSIKKGWEIYQSWSGKTANLNKFSISFSRNIRERTYQQLTVQNSFKKTAANAKYLGLPLSMQRAKIPVFNELRNRVKNRLNGWKAKVLSQAGRLTLIKSVAATIPILYL